MSDQKIPIRGSAPLLQIFDMPTSIHFYCDLIGFKLIETSSPENDKFDWALLRLDNTELMLNTAYEELDRPDAPQPDRIAAHEDTSIYFGCPDVDAAYIYLSAQGLTMDKPTITKYGWKALYVKDPDGYLLSFHWPVG